MFLVSSSSSSSPSSSAFAFLFLLSFVLLHSLLLSSSSHLPPLPRSSLTFLVLLFRLLLILLSLLDFLRRRRLSFPCFFFSSSSYFSIVRLLRLLILLLFSDFRDQVEADPDEIDRVVAAIPADQRNEIVYTNDYIANMSVYQVVYRCVFLSCCIKELIVFPLSIRLDMSTGRAALDQHGDATQPEQAATGS